MINFADFISYAICDLGLIGYAAWYIAMQNENYVHIRTYYYIKSCYSGKSFETIALISYVKSAMLKKVM